MAKGISETAFASQVEDLLKIFHWRWTHFRPAWSAKGYRTPIKGYKGFPDYVAVRPPRLLFTELKSDKTKTSPEQNEWLDDLKECVKQITIAPIEKGKIPAREAELSLFPSFEVYLWRPDMIEEVTRILR